MAELFNQAVFLKFLAALLAVFNPLYGIPVFLSMTNGYSGPERMRVALVVTATVTTVAMIAVLVGEEMLAVFGIDIPSFRIAGGLIIFGVGMAMMNAAGPSPGDQAASDDGHARANKNIAVVPLGIPLTIGPATIAVTIVFAHQLPEGTEIVTLAPAVLIACAITGLGLLFAERISQLLGPTMISVITRVMAILLVAVSIEMVLTGVFNAIDAHYPNLAPSR